MMKRILIVCIFFHSLSMSASSLLTASLAGIAAASMYQNVVIEKEEADTLFIGYGKSSSSGLLVPLPLKDSLKGDRLMYSHCRSEETKCGIGLGKIFIGYRYKTGMTSDDLDNENKKNISKNDWKAITAGVVTGAIVYGFIRYTDKK